MLIYYKMLLRLYKFNHYYCDLILPVVVIKFGDISLYYDYIKNLFGQSIEYFWSFHLLLL